MNPFTIGPFFCWYNNDLTSVYSAPSFPNDMFLSIIPTALIVLHAFSISSFGNGR